MRPTTRPSLDRSPAAGALLAGGLFLVAVSACGPGAPGADSGSDAPAASGSAVSSTGGAGEGHHVEGLGTVRFPASGSAEARPHFVRGLLLLHSFEYGPARAAFDSARALDPDFAMAYWGAAMTHNHPLWRQQDRGAAREILAELGPTPEARRAKAGTERERAYLEAVEALYGEGPKARRDTLYARAMERLVERFPEDDEAKAFHALALLGLNQGDRDVPTYMEAGARALRLFDEHPGHPGAAHYTIHAFDDPAHAPLGLEAARAYGEIAPSAAHAQHMTSHIFLARGLWDDVVAANEAAARTTAAERGHDGELFPCGHYAEWLAYGYLQQGRPGPARETIRRCAALTGGSGRMADPGSVARMRAHYLVDTEAWDGAVAGTAPDRDRLSPTWELAARFADGLVAAERRELEAARAAASGLEARARDLRSGLAADARILAWTLRAVAARRAGDLPGALTAVREAARLEAEQPVPFGPPGTYRPPLELEGELLLEAGRPGEALGAFRRALERTPRRPRALLGLARAASATGDTARAAAAYGELQAIWSHAEDGWPGVEEARRFIGQHDADATSS